MLIEKTISDIFVDFAEIYETIRLNDYSERQKKEMLTLFEGQTIKKCVDFVTSCIQFVTDISSISDLVLSIVQRQEFGSFEAKELFLGVFDKAVALYEEEFRFLNAPFSRDESAVNDEIEEWKKKNNDLKREVELLQIEIDDKCKSLTILENWYNRLNIDFHKLNEKLTEVVHESSTLKNIIEALTSEKHADDEKIKRDRISFLKDIKDLRQCVEEKDAQINTLVEEQKNLLDSIGLLKAEIETKNRLLTESKPEASVPSQKDTSDNVPLPMTDTAKEDDVVCKCKDNMSKFDLVAHKDHNESESVKLYHKDQSEKESLLLCNVENDIVEHHSVAVVRDTKFNEDEIKYTSTRKCLSVELLEALTNLSDDEFNQFDNGMLQYHDKFKNLEESGDSGFHQYTPTESFETKFYSMTSEPLDVSVESSTEASEGRCVDFAHMERDENVRADIHDKLRDIREHLTELERNLKARKRRINKSLCSQLLRIFYYVFEVFL